MHAMRSHDMVKGYLSEILRHRNKVQVVMDELESRIVDGHKSEQVLSPLIDDVCRAIEDYNDGTKAIRQAMVP